MAGPDTYKSGYTTESSDGEFSSNTIGSILESQDGEAYEKLLKQLDKVENQLVPGAEEQIPSHEAHQPKEVSPAKPAVLSGENGLFPPAAPSPTELQQHLAGYALKPDTAPTPPSFDAIDAELAKVGPFNPSHEALLAPVKDAQIDEPLPKVLQEPAEAAPEKKETTAPERKPEKIRSSREHHEPLHSEALHRDLLIPNRFEEERKRSFWHRLKRRANRPARVQARADELARQRGEAPAPIHEQSPAPQQTHIEVQYAPLEHPKEENLPVHVETKPSYESIIEKDVRLQAFSSLGKEIVALRGIQNPSDTDKKALAGKLQLFRDAQLFYADNLDAGALQYIVDSTLEEQQEATDATTQHGETPASQGAEKKFSKLEKVKQWVRSEVALFQEYSGHGWLSGRWHKAGDQLFSVGIAETLDPAEQQAKKEARRRGAILGTMALAVLAAVNRDIDLFTSWSPTDAGVSPMDLHPTGGVAAMPLEAHPTGPLADTTPHSLAPLEAPAEAQGSDDVALEPEIVPIEDTIDNPAFNIPEGGTGTDLFSSLGLDTDVWKANAEALYENFPDDFYKENGDVRIVNSGWLSPEARQFILDLKWGIRGS